MNKGTAFHVGLIGLGRMGLAIASRLLDANISVTGFDTKKIDFLKKKVSPSMVDDITQIPQKTKIIWLMVPAGKAVDTILEQIKDYLTPETIIIDGGNSLFTDTIRRANDLSQKNIFYLDCGTSGGLYGKKNGFSLMIGGNEDAYKKVEPIFKAIAAPSGYTYTGPSGSGHYTKMIHNGIEYVILQAIADGCNLLKNGYYKDLSIEKITGVWSNGSVIRSWIMELLHEIFKVSHSTKVPPSREENQFDSISGAIGENLTGKWALEEAKKQNIDWKLLEQALEKRQWSRETGGDFSTKIVALLRNKFGGHKLTP